MMIAVLLLATGCNRSGLSRSFRSEAGTTLKLIHQAEQQQSRESIAAADTAVQSARAKAENNLDMKTADVLGWYDILLHRHDFQRTQNWRTLCDVEVQLYLAGENSRSAEVWNGYKWESTAVTRGACEQAAFAMMKQDCEELVARRSIRASECAPGGPPTNTEP